jgi:hypothetical protein
VIIELGDRAGGFGHSVYLREHPTEPLDAADQHVVADR